MISRTTFEFRKEQYDLGIINAALRNAKTNRNLVTHFIFATRYYCSPNPDEFFVSWFRQKFLEGMKKYRIKGAVLTGVSVMRLHLVTKEKMTDYHNGKYKRFGYHFDSSAGHSFNDDLEFFFEKLQLEKVTDENVLTFRFPKLTGKEMKLVEVKDEDHMASYADHQEDVSEAEMQQSESKSKFVYVECLRSTSVLQNRPINGYFKRSIHKQSDDEPRSKIRIIPCDSCESVYAYPAFEN